MCYDFNKMVEWKGTKIRRSISIDRTIYYEARDLLQNAPIELHYIKKLNFSKLVQMGLKLVLEKHYGLLNIEYKQKKLELLAIETAMKRENIKNSIVILEDDKDES